MIRKAETKDLDSLILLGFEQYIAEQGHMFGLGYNLLPSIPRAKSIIAEEVGVCHVVDIDDKVQGFCMWEIISFMSDYAQPIFHQTGLYVRPEFRSNGYGSELIEAGERWADEKNINLKSIGAAAIGSPEFLKSYYEKKGYSLFQLLFFKNSVLPIKKE